MTAAELAERIGSTSQRGEWFDTLCPAHTDERPSLSFTDAPRGLRFHCHKGCKPKDIAAAFQREFPGLKLGRVASPARGSLGEPAAVYAYHDERRVLLYEVVRFEPKEFRQRRPDGKGGYVWNIRDVRRVLYRLPDLTGRNLVWVVEGEKDAERLWTLGLAATTCSGGAGKWLDEYSEQLRAQGVEYVACIPDNDETGEQHAHDVTRSCVRAKLPSSIVTLPGLPAKGDVSNWLDQGGTKRDLLRLFGEVAPIEEEQSDDASAQPKGEQARPVVGKGIAARLVGAAEAAGLELFHTPLGEAFVAIQVGSHKEIMRVDGADCRSWLSRLGWQRLRTAIASDVLNTAIQFLAAKARYDGPEERVHLRTAWHEGALYYDLCDSRWRVVKIAAAG